MSSVTVRLAPLATRFAMSRRAATVDTAPRVHEAIERPATRPWRQWPVGRVPPVVVLVLLAILVGSLLRFVDLKGLPPGLNQDEAVNGYDAYSLFLTGRDHHGHPFPFAGLESFGDWASPLLTFLTVPAVGLFGLHVEVVRSVSAAVGTLAIPIMYLLGVELFQRQSIGVLAAWYIALSPWHVHSSRFAIPPAVVPTMIALTMFMLIWSIHHRSSRGVVALALISAFTIAGYPTMKLYVPLILLAALCIYGPIIVGLKREALCYAAVVFLAITGPIYYLSLADPGGRARLDQVSAFDRAGLSPAFFAAQYKSYFSPWVFFIAGNGHPAQSPTPPGFGVEPRSALPFLLIGFLWLIAAVIRPARPMFRRSALFVLTALALYPVPGSLTLPTPPLVNPHLARGLQLIPLLALIAAAGAIEMVAVARHALRDAPIQVVRGVLALLVIAVSVPLALELGVRYDDYFHKYTYREDVLAYYQYGLEPTLRYVRDHAAAYDHIWVTDVNQPYIYVLFYAAWPPTDVHNNLQVRRAPPAFDVVDAIGKYHFGDPAWVRSGALTLLYTVRDPDGQVAYEVRGGYIAGEGRVLLVHKPSSLAGHGHIVEARVCC